MAEYEYPGTELELFAEARCWKDYLRLQIAPYLVGDILEIGAGIGGTSRVLLTNSVKTWTCLEPDVRLFAQLSKALQAYAAREGVPARAVRGTLAGLPVGVDFDCLLYVDVLEHIEDDRTELAIAASHTRRGGTIVVLSPAHQWLFSEFDQHVGHVRRYARRRLQEITPVGTRLECLRYLDSVGLLASLANRWLLRASVPTSQQIRIWDSMLVRTSRAADPWLGYRAGKSVLGVYRRSGG